MNPNLPIIVGESNPYGHDPYFALYPEPEGCSGDRLCRVVMGLRRKTYMSSFERVNLLEGPKWSMSRARQAAGELRERSSVFVLLGGKVCDAFRVNGDRPRVIGARLFPVKDTLDPLIVMLPHPSGRCRAWGEPGMVERCRELLRSAMPSIPFGELDHPPLPKDVPHLFERVPVPNTFVDLRFTWCRSCTSDPDYRGPCDCSHAPCVHQGEVK